MFKSSQSVSLPTEQCVKEDTLCNKILCAIANKLLMYIYCWLPLSPLSIVYVVLMLCFLWCCTAAGALISQREPLEGSIKIYLSKQAKRGVNDVDSRRPEINGTFSILSQTVSLSEPVTVQVFPTCRWLTMQNGSGWFSPQVEVDDIWWARPIRRSPVAG